MHFYSIFIFNHIWTNDNNILIHSMTFFLFLTWYQCQISYNQDPRKRVLSTYICNSQSAADNSVRILRIVSNANSELYVECLYLIVLHYWIGCQNLLPCLTHWECGLMGWGQAGHHISYNCTASLALLTLAWRVEEMLGCNGKAGVPYTCF